MVIVCEQLIEPYSIKFHDFINKMFVKGTKSTTFARFVCKGLGNVGIVFLLLIYLISQPCILKLCLPIILLNDK